MPAAQRSSLAALWAALAVLALLPFLTPASANHGQTEMGRTVSFDHKTGNEWWVEVTLAGADASSATGVQAMDTNGPWVSLEKKSWGAWAASFHIAPGHDVRFRALWSDGDLVTSCWFTHPAGVEKACSPTSSTTTTTASSSTTTTSSSTSTTSPPSGFDATFTNVRGNAWWQQAQVSANQPVAKVDLRLDGGEWRPVTKHSWGWGVSYHAPEGTTVQFRATSATGSTDVSACYRWVPPSGQNALETACPGTNPPPPEEVPPPRSTPWHQSTIGEIGGDPYRHPLLSVGDGNRDGSPELYYAGAEGIMHMVAANTLSMVTSIGGWIGLTVGDGDGDGRHEIYAIRGAEPDVDELHRFSYDGTRWNGQIIARDWNMRGPITVGDLDGDGRNEVYAGIESTPQDTCCAAGIVRIERTGADSWSSTLIVEFGNGGYFLDVDELWVGDADNDGRNELAVLLHGRDYSPVHLVERVDGQWRQQRILDSAGPYAGDIVVGDADGNGRNEVIVGQDLTGHVSILHHSAGTWREEVVDTNIQRGFVRAFFGDADNDGRPELVLGGEDARIYQMKREAEGWRLDDLGKVGTAQATLNDLVVGNGDYHPGQEIYVGTFDHGTGRAYATRLAKEAPPGPPTFDAQFSNVKGNTWWAEVVVAANTPVHAVMLIIDCDTSRDPADMTYRADWGKWVLGNTHIPTGAKVTFWAHGDGGSEHSGGYVWPNATPTTGC